MEKIKINDMQTKGVVFIVKYYYSTGSPDGAFGTAVREATLNTSFNAQEISYLENDVGIGGTVEVQITNKEKVKGNPSAGFWVNITKVNFESAQKDTVNGTVNETETHTGANLMPQKDIGMCAGGMLKCYYYNHTPKDNEEIIERYRAFVLELEQNG